MTPRWPSDIRAAGAGPGARRPLELISGLAILIASAVAMWALGESEWPMLVLCLGGVIAGRVAGIADRHLAAIAIGVTAVAWPLALLALPGQGAASTLAHLVVAAVLAWVIAAPARRRWPLTRASPGSPRWFAIPALVLAVGAAWEVGEWAADALLGADLIVRATDTALDLLADFLGAVIGLGVHDRMRARRDGDPRGADLPDPSSP